MFQVGAPRHDWLPKECQADQTLKCRHTTYTPSAVVSSTATHVALVQHAPSLLVKTLAATATSVDAGPSACAGTAVQAPTQPAQGAECAPARAHSAQRIPRFDVAKRFPHAVSIMQAPECCNGQSARASLRAGPYSHCLADMDDCVLRGDVRTWPVHTSQLSVWHNLRQARTQTIPYRRLVQGSHTWRVLQARSRCVRLRGSCQA